MTIGIEKTALFSTPYFCEIELQPWKLISPLHVSEVALFLQTSQNQALICYAVTFLWALHHGIIIQGEPLLRKPPQAFYDMSAIEYSIKSP